MTLERGFVPPMARRRHHDREQEKRKNIIQSITAACILACFGAVYLIFNIKFVRTMKQQQPHSQPVDVPSSSSSSAAAAAAAAEAEIVRQMEESNSHAKLRKRQTWISQDSQPFNHQNWAKNAHHLIMVAGHSVTVSGDLEDADIDESDWWLLDYQKHQGLPQAIKGHIQAGIDEANRDPDSLLVFSGGETRAVTGPMTEATSYFHVADAMGLWPAGSTVRARTTTEEFATDSFENLMFSICRFKEITGSYPTKITTVSFTFKQKRFETLHAPALRIPKDNFYYIGVDPPESTGFNLERSQQGEMQNAAAPFEADPYGCSSPVLQAKRKERNPFSRTPPYELSCPEMKELLHYCGPEIIPENLVPWK